MTAPRRKNGVLVKFIETGCTNKIRYPDAITARAAGQYYGDCFNHALYLYQCPYCKGWHLTKKKPNGERGKNPWYNVYTMDQL